LNTASASPPAHRAARPRRAVVLALAVPLAIGAAWSLLLETTPLSLLAPLAGPWAGLLYGHEECTMASAMPLVAWLSVAGLALAAALALHPSTRARAVTSVPVALLAAWWVWMALMSVLNTQA
jgi:hypothetical protein